MADFKTWEEYDARFDAWWSTTGKLNRTKRLNLWSFWYNVNFVKLAIVCGLKLDLCEGICDNFWLVEYRQFNEIWHYEIGFFLQDYELERAINSKKGPGQRNLQALWGAIQTWSPQVGGWDSSGRVEICGQEGNTIMWFSFFWNRKWPNIH